MALTREEKGRLTAAHQKHERDTGSAEVQIALLSEQIRRITQHLKTHKHDYHSQRGLMLMVGQRKRHLRYLRRTNPQGYVQLINQLGIRG
jgi:small subunit ribosomal protein S15